MISDSACCVAVVKRSRLRGFDIQMNEGSSRHLGEGVALRKLGASVTCRNSEETTYIPVDGRLGFQFGRIKNIHDIERFMLGTPEQFKRVLFNDARSR